MPFPLKRSSSLLIICLGVISIYQAKIYSEVKARPRYLVSETINE